MALGRRGGVRQGAGLAGRRSALPAAVARYIGAAYWFTASTSFANPAVTIARAATDTFSGIAPGGVSAFIGAQLVGALVGALLTELFYPRPGVPEPLDLPGPVHVPEIEGAAAAADPPS